MINELLRGTRGLTRVLEKNDIVYLKVNCALEFPQLGLLLSPGAAPESFEHDSENVYEWMYVAIPGIPFVLNISREHGWADIDDEVLDFNSDIDPETLKHLAKPGPVYIIGWNRTANARVDSLPDWLPQYMADLLLVPVNVYVGCHNVDLPDPEPLATVYPHGEQRS